MGGRIAMSKPLIWIIDEEWPDYDVEKALLEKAFPGCDLRFSGNDYGADLDAFGSEAGYYKGGSRSQVARFDLGAHQFLDSLDNSGVAFDGDVGSHAPQFCRVHEAVFVYGFCDYRGA